MAMGSARWTACMCKPIVGMLCYGNKQGIPRCPLAVTCRAIIVEECMKTGGIGASLSAVIHESLFNELDHEVVRLSSQDVPTAYAYELEAATIVQPEKVVAAVQRVVGQPQVAYA